MIYRNSSLKHFLVLQIVIQVMMLTCLTQEADVPKGSWDLTDVDSENLLEKELLNDLQTDKSDWNPNEKLNMKQEGSMDDVTREKRVGKRRKTLSNKNRMNIDKYLEQQHHGNELYDVAEMNSDQDYLKKEKRTLNSINRVRDNSSSSNSKLTMFKSFRHNIGKLKPRNHFKLANTKPDHSNSHAARKLEEFHLTNSTLNGDPDKESENVVTSTANVSLENRKPFQDHKFKSKEAKTDEKIEMSPEIRKKNNYENPANTKQEYHTKTNNAKSITKSQNKTHKNTIKSDEIKKDKYGFSNLANKFTNLSVINKSFLDAFEKKIHGINIGLNGIQGLNTIGPVIEAHPKKDGKWIFYDKELDKNKLKKGHNTVVNYADLSINNDLNEAKFNAVIDENPNKSKSNQPYKHANNIHTNKNSSKYLMIKQSIKGSKNTENIAHPTVKLNHRRHARKKVENDGHIESVKSGEELLDPVSESNGFSIAFDTNQENIKRRERDASKNTAEINNAKLFDSFSREEMNDEEYESSLPESQDGFMSEIDSNENSEYKKPTIEVKDNENSNYRKKEIIPKEEEEDADMEDDTNNLFDKEDSESKYNEDESSTPESCVGYKSERETTEKTTSIRDNTTFKKLSTKPHTTKKANKKSQTTSKTVEDVTASTSPTVGGNYEQFLCGQLVDSFIESVLKKVQRSRKIAKELGFSNDTEDSCDRCIELKSKELPDLEAMKYPLGTCSNDTVSTCYQVPNIMETYLKTLLLIEKEKENIAYNKMVDDSSFIFTGDYSESLPRKEYSSSDNSKLHSDREGFNKESMDKQRLSDEKSDDYSYDQGSNQVKVRKETKLSHPKNKIKYELEDPVDTTQKESEELMESEVNSAESRVKFEGKKKKESSRPNPVESDNGLNGNEVVDVFDNQDAIPANTRYYSPHKDPDNDFTGYLNENPSKRRRNNYDIGTISISKPEIKKQFFDNNNRNVGANPYGQRNHKFLKTNPEMSKINTKQTNSRTAFRREDNLRQQFGTSNSFQNGIINSGNGYIRTKSLTQPATDKGKINYYNYYPDVYSKHNFENSHKRPDKNVLYSDSDRFENKDWENGEYELYPNELNAETEDLKSISKNMKNDFDSSLNMVKRETDPNEDELIFFEIPDIEYDLY